MRDFLLSVVAMAAMASICFSVAQMASCAKDSAVVELRSETIRSRQLERDMGHMRKFNEKVLKKMNTQPRQLD